MKTLDTFPRCFDVYSRVCLPSVSPICAVPAQQGQDEFLYTQKHSGTSCSTQTANGVQSRSAGMQSEIYNSPFNFFSVFDWCFWSTTVLSFFSQIQRLPFLSSSNLALDTLRGSDESIGFEDILNGQDVGVLHCCWHEGPRDDFLTPRLLSVFLQIQPRAKWWGSRTSWWNTNWDCCERFCRTHSSHFDYYYLFVYSGLKKQNRNKNYVQCFTCMIPVFHFY